MTRLAVALCVLCGVSGVSAVAFADGTLSGRVTDVNNQPLQGVGVVLVGPGGRAATAVTDPNGVYTATVRAGGRYAVTFALGHTRNGSEVDIPDGGVANLDGMLEIGSAEVIEVHGHNPFEAPMPKTDPYRIPPYSDAAALGDHWAKAWLLLDVDARGVVSQIKFLKRPGFGLEDIAVKYAFNLRFDPSHDPSGKPRQSYIVYPLEWPALGWLQSRGQLAVRMPTLPEVSQRTRLSRRAPDGMLIDGVNGTGYPACANGQALNLSEVHPMQRDCTMPDLAVAEVEPWIQRGADIPAPVVAEAPTIDPTKFYQDELAAVRHTRIAAIATAVGAVGLAAGGTLAYLQMRKASDRVDFDDAHRLTVSASQGAADRSRMVDWELATIGLGAGMVISGIASLHLWANPPPVTVMPGADGGVALSYGGKF